MRNVTLFLIAMAIIAGLALLGHQAIHAMHPSEPLGFCKSDMPQHWRWKN